LFENPDLLDQWREFEGWAICSSGRMYHAWSVWETYLKAIEILLGGDSCAEITFCNIL